MLCRDELAVEYPVVQNYLTQRYTEDALRFIEEKKDEPFFLYFPHAMPHKPLAASEDYYQAGGVAADLYAAVIRELDWSVGRVLDKLRSLGLDQKTLVLFASDNGPWHGGSTGGLRGMKGSTWEGGIRVPGIFWWPGRIEGGRAIDEPAATIDVFPTVCALLGIDSAKYQVDGYDILPLLRGEDRGPERAIFAWNGTNLMAAREGRWKLHRMEARARPVGKRDEVWIDERGPDGVTIIAPFEQSQPWEYPSPLDAPETAPGRKMQLFDLENDPGEQVDVTVQHPEIVDRLSRLMESELATVESTTPWQRAETKFYLGPGRITEDSAIPIDEALRRTRERAR